MSPFSYKIYNRYCWFPSIPSISLENKSLKYLLSSLVPCINKPSLPEHYASFCCYNCMCKKGV